MAFATINKGSSYFNTVLYTGNGSTQSITGVEFKPDFVWIKSRSNTFTHLWYDIIRGAGKYLQSPSTGAEGGDSGDLLGSFNTDGFQVNNTLTGGTNPSTNGTSSTFVAWNWLGANTTVSNTSGTISSTVSANTTAGFSIVSYTGNGSTSATVGHGLGVIPAMIIIKNRSDVSQWLVKHKSLATDYNLQLNVTDAQVYLPSGTGQGGVGNLSSSSTFGFTSGTTGVNNVNNSGSNFIAYCFAEVKGYSKFGSYTGNGSTDGTFVYTGFKPAFVLWKRTDFANGWFIFDNKRNTFNPEDKYLLPYASDAEATLTALDFCSNGFKFRSSTAAFNASGGTFIYMAFAENPFVLTDGTPVTAR
jgi:hypothetical protein